MKRNRRYAPEYCYVGSTEGDGACIGCWPILEEVQRAVRDGEILGVSDTSELQGACRLPLSTDRAVFALHVNDHGNATLYRRAGQVWREVWSVV